MITKIAIVNIWLVDICDKYPVRTKIIRIRTEFAIQLQYQEYWADQDSSYMANFKILGWLGFQESKHLKGQVGPPLSCTFFNLRGHFRPPVSI